MKELRPCPFCGGKAVLFRIEPHTHQIAKMPDYEGGVFIECSKCGVFIIGESRKETVDKWNSRANGWIPVSERLPEEDGKYLCCTKLGSRIMANYYPFGNTHRWRTFGSVANAIVAWQPLPKPYKEVEE